MKNNVRIGLMGQWLSLAVTITGLTFMLVGHTVIWHDLITGGAVLLTISTKVRYYGGLIREKKKRNKIISIRTIIEDDNALNKAKRSTL